MKGESKKERRKCHKDLRGEGERETNGVVGSLEAGKDGWSNRIKGEGCLD